MRVRTTAASCLALALSAALAVPLFSPGPAVGARPTTVADRTPTAGAAPLASQRRRPHWVVTIGDSYISGEGGRWGGNTAGPPDPVDALGDNAYYDGKGREKIPGCHRSEAAEAYVRTNRLRGVNLACSGAQTRTEHTSDSYTPGVDFYRDKQGRVGQLILLRRFARTHKVSDVVVSIGGNDFGFASIIAQCLQDYESSTPLNKNFCSDDKEVRRHFTRKSIERVTVHIKNALLRTRIAMRQAGYTTRDYAIVMQTYPSPLSNGKRIRYPETQERSVVGGCPFWNKDANAAQTLLLGNIIQAERDAVRRTRLPNIHFLQLRKAFYGRRLCEKSAGQLQETGLSSWKSRGAVNQLEWVNMLYLTKPPPWQLQESVHPNYWGHLAVRSCVRQSVRGPGARSGSCVRAGKGLTRRGEPRMRLRR